MSIVGIISFNGLEYNGYIFKKPILMEIIKFENIIYISGLGHPKIGNNGSC